MRSLVGDGRDWSPRPRADPSNLGLTHQLRDRLAGDDLSGIAQIRQEQVSALVVVAYRDVAFGLNLFLANLLADLLVFGDTLRGELDPLDRDGFLADDRPLLGQHDLVLLLADVGSSHGLVAVGVGDRLSFHPDLLPADRHGDGLLLGDDVLAQSGPAGLNLLRADLELLLGAGHRLIRRRPRGVVALAARLLALSHAALSWQAGVGAPLGVVQAVVAVQLRLLVLGEVALLDVDGGGVLDLVLGVGNGQPVVSEVCLGERDE